MWLLHFMWVYCRSHWKTLKVALKSTFNNILKKVLRGSKQPEPEHFIKKIVHCWTYFHSSSLQIANSLKLLWDLTNSCSAPSAESRASSNGINLIATHWYISLLHISLLLFLTNVFERLAKLDKASTATNGKYPILKKGCQSRLPENQKNEFITSNYFCSSLFFERGESWPSCAMKLAASWSPAALPACHVLPSFQQLHLFIASFFVASINVSLPVVNFFVVAK